MPLALTKASAKTSTDSHTSLHFLKNGHLRTIGWMVLWQVKCPRAHVKWWEVGMQEERKWKVWRFFVPCHLWLKQGLTKLPRLALNLLYSPGRSESLIWKAWSSCLSLPDVGTIRFGHCAWLFLVHLTSQQLAALGSTGQETALSEQHV